MSYVWSDGVRVDISGGAPPPPLPTPTPTPTPTPPPTPTPVTKPKVPYKDIIIGLIAVGAVVALLYKLKGGK